MSRFNKGDIVKKTYGKVLYEVQRDQSSGSNLSVKNLNTGKVSNYEYGHEYKLVTDFKQIEKERNMSKLYEFEHDGKTVYGSQLAINSNNKAVMEIKGSDTPVVVDRDKLTEVVPYTISVRSVKNGNFYIVETVKGKVNKQDLLIARSGEFYTVKELDTKKYATSGGPTITRRVKTEAISI